MRLPFDRPAAPARLKMSEIMSAMSYALDLVEGQPQGHAVRSCIIGMRIGRDYGLDDAALSNLYYALLMKDLGCSSNAAKMCYLFAADDRETKGDIKTVNWRNPLKNMAFALKHVAPGEAMLPKLKRICGLAVHGKRAGKELIEIRCERGANIARHFGLSEETALAIHALDEHYDGGGHPEGLRGAAIPILARILGLAQTAEVFLRREGRDRMRDMVRARRKSWFDPTLCDVLLKIADEDPLWEQITGDAGQHIGRYEPADRELFATDSRLDDIASGFAEVIDAKSPWTFKHSTGVAKVAAGIGATFGMSVAELRELNRAALLHDIGKLGVSNLILDKPAKLDADELTAMRRHPEYTYQILKRVTGFSHLAVTSAAHHERLDGKGYFRGMGGNDLSLPMRILAVADMYEALAASRPYRQDLSHGEVMTILEKNSPNGICPEVLSALKTSLANGGYVPDRVAA
ncbi:MAG: HD-GYP domain-containing protein [Tepidisphaeraceae bacterium]